MLSVDSGIDCLTIPRLRKRADGSYTSRSMNLDLSSLVELRSEAIGASLRAFDPDLFIVDKKARGALGELDPVLRWLRERGKARIVLGLRDVLDCPEAVAREWEEEDSCAAIREYYDAVWVYGDRAVHDLASELRLPAAIGQRFHYTGYFDQRVRLSRTGKEARDLLAEAGVNDNPFVLCLVGGGEDGMPLAESFARAELPRGMHGVVVMGPFMPAPFRRALHDLAAARPRLHVLDFVHEPTPLIAAAARVISMGGYCTFTELVSLEKPALIVPRVHPRREQLIRAERFAELGLVDYLRPDRLTPATLTGWLAGNTRVGQGARNRIDLGGLERLPQMAEALLKQNSPAQSKPGAIVPFPRRSGEGWMSGPTIPSNLEQAERL